MDRVKGNATGEVPNEPNPPCETNKNSARRKLDIAWAHCTLVSEKPLKVKCNYCARVLSGGGIHRFKEHLANKKGQTEPCKKVPNHVQYQMQSNLESSKVEKRKRVDESISSHSASFPPATTTSKESATETNLRKFFPPATTPGSQPLLKSVWASKEVVHAADYAIASWMFKSHIPFHSIALPKFQKMLDDVASVGLGYKAPTPYSIGGPLLNESVKNIKEYIESFRKHWEIYGCTLMADGWTDGRNRTLINFLVYYPEGTVFLKSVDASNHSKTQQYLHGLFKEVVDFVGPQNVVHFVTDNASNYAAAGKSLKYDYEHIEWSPCAAHCIYLMLEKFDGLPTVQSAISEGRKVTKFIYNHGFVLSLMRKHCNKELIRPGATRFATNFLALQSLCEQRDSLIAMVACKEWLDHKISKTKIANEVKEIILDSSFWDLSMKVIKIVEPLVQVLPMVDSEERPCMGYIYAGMRAARKTIKAAFDENQNEYIEFFKIIDEKWENQLHHPFHAASYFLNPEFYYKDCEDFTFEEYKIMASFYDVVMMMHRNEQPNADQISKELGMYRNARGMFGHPMAVSAHNQISLVEWWQNFGGETPTLKRMAIRLLSQTCSASACERNWCVFESVHTKKRNRLLHARLNDLVFVEYNMRLREKQHQKNWNPISFEGMGLVENWTEESEDISNEDLEAWLDLEGIENMATMEINDD